MPSRSGRRSPPGAFHYPGYGTICGWPGLYFLKVAELGATAQRGQRTCVFTLAVCREPCWLRLIYLVAATREETGELGLPIALLLWFPLPFYTYSVAYGSVPIFFPQLVSALLVQHTLWHGAAAGASHFFSCVAAAAVP